MLLPADHITLDYINIPATGENDISVAMLRLDKIHTKVSGNKLFKLHYFIEDCLRNPGKTLVTFGGAWSNHLVAAAFLCREKGIKAVGIVRGEEPALLSQTLQHCRKLGMQLRFISRADYRNAGNEEFQELIKEQYGDSVIVPEGGFSPGGAKGASLIMNMLKDSGATHICTAVGTATTLAGLLMKKNTGQEIIAVPVIKSMTDIGVRMEMLTGDNKNFPAIFDQYHFGGYAKYSGTLINFMNDFYASYHIPLDFVYTGKMMFGITDQIKKGYFKRGSRVICLHTGGLQGNISLPKGTLIF